MEDSSGGGTDNFEGQTDISGACADAAVAIDEHGAGENQFRTRCSGTDTDRS